MTYKKNTLPSMVGYLHFSYIATSLKRKVYIGLVLAYILANNHTLVKNIFSKN
jgi:hypothetical protein